MTPLPTKKLLLTVSLIALGTILAVFIGKQHLTKQSQTKQSYFTNLATQEQELWQKWQSIGLPKEEFNRRCQAYKQESANQAPSITVTEQNKSRVYEILHKMGLSGDQFTLTPYNDHSAAAYANNIIYLNESRFAGLPAPAQEFAIAHEIQHYNHDDDITISVLEDWIKEKQNENSDQKNMQELQGTFNQFSRFVETRADIETALLGKDFAQSYISFFETALKEKGENAGITHPKNSERLALAKEIYQQENLA